jgi:hypothetical protein
MKSLIQYCICLRTILPICREQVVFVHKNDKIAMLFYEDALVLLFRFKNLCVKICSLTLTYFTTISL